MLDKYFWFLLILFVGSLIFSITIVQTTVIVLLLLWTIKIYKTPEYQFVRTPFDIPYIVFVASRIISIPLSVNVSESLLALPKEIFFYIIFFIVTNVLSIEDKDRIRKLFLILIIAAAIAGIYGSAKVILKFEDRATSTTSGYGTLGMILAATISLAYGLGKNRDIIPSRWLWGLSLTAMGCGILFTFNRIHWGVVGVIFIIVGLLRERKTLLISLGFIALSLIFISPVRDRFFQLLHFWENTSGRNILWKGAFMLIMKKPIFGFGPRTFSDIFPLFDQLEDKGIASWHCDYLQVYMESGIIGLVSFIWLIIMIYYFGFKIIREKKLDVFYRDITIGIILAMTAFFLTGLVGGFVIDPLSSLLFRFLLAILALMGSLQLRIQKIHESKI